MPLHDYALLDVFGAGALDGNPLAVVFDADSIPASRRQRLARWFNLSETVFVGRPRPDGVPVRIHTPVNELPFAGHPVVGCARALVETGRAGAEGFTLLCGRGPVAARLDREGNPRVRVTPPEERAFDGEGALGEALGGLSVGAPRLLDVGPVWLTGQLDDATALYRFRPDWRALEILAQAVGATGVNLYALDVNRVVHVRSLAPGDAVPEDPVCGSGNLCVAWHRYLAGDLAIGARHVGHQGMALGRDGRVEVEIRADHLVLGGRATLVARGTVQM